MKLWIVRIERAAYVMAETEADAIRQQGEIERWEDEADVTAEPLESGNPLGWDAHSLVYHSGRADLTLESARKLCTPPKVGEDDVVKLPPGLVEADLVGGEN